MSIDRLEDKDIVELLQAARTIAVVGVSANVSRPSHGVAAYLQRKGYRLRLVNPGLEGQQLLGEGVYARLADVPPPVDIVDIFRNSAAAGGIVREAIAQKDRLGIRAVWMQLGVIDEAAAEEARAAGLTVVMDRCPKIEIPRLSIAAPAAG